MNYLTYSYTPSNANINPEIEYNHTKLEISQRNNGLILTALEEGQSEVTVSYGNYSATCIITISGFSSNYTQSVEPYIYSNTSILQLSPGMTEKIFVSLYGGSVIDNDNYTWTVDDNSICTIQPTGQYCLINAKNTGYTRIKVTNSKATYPYYIGVYVFDDYTKTTYITTSDNVLTLNSNDGDKTISVNLVNAEHITSEGNFSWEIINETNNASCPISLISNGTKAVITPIKSGICTIRVTNPEALYPLDIVCRVITIIENVYIEPNQTIVTLSGDNEESIICDLKNIKYGEYSIDDYSYHIENEDVANITASIGNQVFIKGVKNGSTKLIISHKNVEYTREVLLISTNQLADAINSSYYITTNQNYIKTKVGGSITELNVQLKGGEDGDEKNFIWSVVNTPSDGNGNVIKLETTNGKTESRSVYTNFIDGKAYITPIKEGTAVITITHPKVLYSTEILVKVLPENAILEEPLYFTGAGLVRLINGDETTYTVGLKGQNKTIKDEQNINWNNDDNRIVLQGNETTARIKAPTVGTGNTISHINISHPKVDTPKTVLVLTADTEEELMNMKALYSSKNYYNLEVGKSVSVICEQVGFIDDIETGSKYDFSLFQWRVLDPNVISIEKNPNDPLCVKVTGLKAGTSKLIGSIEGYTCEFTITVYPVGTVNIESDVYLTTTQNVVYLNEIGLNKNISITAVNLSSSKYSNITWNCNDSTICDVIPNGNSANIISKKIGEAIITCSHPDSQNELKIYVRIGNQYVNNDANPVIYISSQDVITMLRSDNAQKLQATLVNNNNNLPNNFNFTIDNTNIAKITAQTQNGIAYISPVGSGQAEITITNTLTDITKKVLVVVGNSAEELASYKYLTTSTNVITIGEGNTRSVNVSVKNSEDLVLNGYTWSSSDSDIVSITPNENTAVLKANNIGIARITVKNSCCTYPLEIIVQVVDPIQAASNPYIQLSSNVMILNVDNNYSTVTADLIGGKEEDNSYFEWIVSDPTICQIYSQNDVCKIKAIGEGQTIITVKNNSRPGIYESYITVVCEKKEVSECYISVPSSIISLKPTDTSQTITANLVNGNNNDKYNFKWSLDVYDVIDYQYSANVCVITPKQTGTVTITISHPKAEFDQQIIVTVTEYTTFAFPTDSYTLTQGDVKFINMQIPTTNVKTHVEYTVENPNICTVSGTKKVAQIQAINKGTTTVKARLIATTTGIEQANAEMMVYVSEKALTDAYITTSSTIYTVAKGKSQTLSANLTGSDILVTDQNDLMWTTNDSDIIKITGISSNGIVKGNSIYITALQSGEAIITCSHPKAASNLQFYVVVPGSGTKTITLNKSFITLVKGSKTVQLTASIENMESNDDYNNIEWSCIGANGVDGSGIARVMGSGKTVEIYPVSPGEVTVYAQLPDAASVAQCTVKVEAGKSFSFENTAVRVNPCQTKVIKYQVSPPNAIITWTRNSNDDYFDYEPSQPDENGNGTVSITGLEIGQGVLIASTDGGATAKITVKTSWNYDFKITGNTAFSKKPNEQIEYDYTVYPENATFNYESTQINTYFSIEEIVTGTETDSNGSDYRYGKLILKTLKECRDTINLNITAINPANQDTIGTKRITGNIQYDRYTPNISFVARNGTYSRFTDNGEVILADGENIVLDVTILENAASGKVDDVIFEKVSNSGIDTIELLASEKIIDGKNGMSLTLKETKDIVETIPIYHIKHLYEPSYNGVKIDWKNDLKWRGYYVTIHHPIASNEYDEYFGLALKTTGNNEPCMLDFGFPVGVGGGAARGSPNCGWLYIQYQDWSSNQVRKSSLLSLTENLDYQDTYMSKTEFEHIPWLYCPGTPDTYGNHKDISEVTLEMFENGTLKVGGYGDGGKCHMEPCIMIDNVDAELVDIESTDNTSIETKLVGYLKFRYVCDGLVKNDGGIKIPVYREVYKSRNGINN